MRVIAQAPVTFFAALAVLSAIIWKLLAWRHAAKDDLITLYKARLDGATPDQARARIDKLETTIRRTVGSEWPPLTPQQIQALSREVANIEKRRIQVMYLNLHGKTLAKGIADAFEAAGWDVHFSMGGGFEDGLFVGRSPTLGPLLRAAIERATSLKAIYEAPNKGWPEDGPHVSVYVAVGTNSA
jgi:plasmid stabilization system protein ParE